ncbi:MAG TPA: adenylate/guanylate cyclase domain-containing protein [Thermoleophilaceae bacterium]|jgi:class 3 adenylate cyclase|nr:adenylate/guanylate cyclase domain-containing protein [Thermoleophilaceae bacterium]
MTTEEVPKGRDELHARVGELRRLTIMFSDVVGSTELSGRQEPEVYRELMKGYRMACRDVIESRFDGHILTLKGDGTLSTFGFPVAHENDAERAVRAGLALVRAVRELSKVTVSTAGEPLDVRIGIHHGPVYLDLDEDDIYGLTANVGARLHGLAEPGTVVVSDELRQLVEDLFEIEPGEPQVVKGVAEPLVPFRVLCERRVPVQRSWSTPLVERRDELQQLREAWAEVSARAEERAAGVLVRGDAGVGKSRLVAELADDVRAESAPVVQLHGSSLHLDAGFHPVRFLVEARCGIIDETQSPERLDRLARDLALLGFDAAETVPLLAPVLGIDPSAGYDQAATEGRKLEEQVSQAVLDYLLACTEGRAALIVAENLHWFDPATRELLADLVRNTRRRVLIVGTSRNQERVPWDTVELQPLTLEGRLALIDALRAGLTDQDRLQLATRSDGIPLYLEELVRAGTLDNPATAGTGAPVPGAVPEALYEPLVARLYSTPAALPVAATAAAAGQEVDRSLLAATMSLDAGQLESTLLALVDARVLEPVEAGAERYRFRHELLREVAYELQPASWRRKVHNRLCDLLARGEPSDWLVLASHYERAERNLEAAMAYQQTAESARRRGALEEARSHLTRAIELVLPLTDDAAHSHTEVELRLRRGFLAMSAEGAASADASADFDRCLELAAADPRGDHMFSTLISVWVYDLSRAELDRARQVSETLRAAVGGGRDYFRPQNLAGFGMLDWFAGSFASAADTLAAATHDLAEIGREDEVAAAWFVPNDPTAAMHVHLALARFMAGDMTGADECVAHARAVAASLDFPQGPWSTAYAGWLGSWMWIEAGRLEQAAEAVAELSSLSARHGFDSWELIAATQAAVLQASKALLEGNSDAALLSAYADEVSAYIEVWQMLELRLFQPFYLTITGALQAAARDFDGARERYEQSLQLAADTGMRFYDAETRRRLAHLETDRDAVVAALRSALDLARSQAARPFEQRIALDLR